MKDIVFSTRGHSSPSSEGRKSIRRPFTIFALVSVFALSLNTTSWASNITWIGGSGGFDTPGNWSSSTIPGAGATAIFNDTPNTPGITNVVSLNISNDVVGSVLVSNSVVEVLWLANTNTLTILNSFLFDAGNGNTPMTNSLNNGIVAATNVSGTAIFQVGNAADGGLGTFEMQHQYSAGLVTGDTSVTNYPTLIANNFVVVNGSTFTFSAGTLTTAGSSITNSGGLVGLGSAASDIATWNMQGTNLANAATIELATVANGTMDVNVSGSNTLWSVTASDLYVGWNGTANLLVSNGAHISNSGTIWLSRNGAASSNNTITVTGAGSRLTTVSELFVGDAGPNNTMTVSAGGVVMSATGRLGQGSGVGDSNNTVVVTGPNSLWEMTNTSSFLQIGADNTAGNSLIISNGGEVINMGTFTRMGLNASSGNNSLIVDGAGSQFIAGGTNTSSGYTYVGNNGFGNVAIVKNGGFIHNNARPLDIGAGAGASNDTVVVTDTNSLWIADDGVFVGLGDVGNQLIVSNAGEFRVNTGIDVSSAGAAGGAVLVSGGTLSATNSVTNGYIRVALENAQGTFTFNGGTINVDTLLLTNGTASLFTFNSGVLNVKSSLVTNGVAFVVGNGTSAATLNLQGLSHSYGNGLSISANGTLAGLGTINGSVTLANGATLAPGSGVTVGTLTVNGDLALGNSSVLEFALGSASDEIIVNGNLTMGGTLDISNSGGFGTGIYPLFTYTGTLVNNGVTVGTTPSPAFQYSVDTTSEVGVVNLDVTSAPLGPFATWQLQYFNSTSCPLCGTGRLRRARSARDRGLADGIVAVERGFEGDGLVEVGELGAELVQLVERESSLAVDTFFERITDGLAHPFGRSAESNALVDEVT